MDSNIKMSIESRKTAIFSAYDVKDEGNLAHIDDFFKRLEDFAKDCKDVMDFETKFASSPLSKEYSDIFVQIMQTETTTDGVAPVQEKEEEYTLHDEMVDDVKRHVRGRAKYAAWDKARSLPVIGDAMTAKQHLDFFGRFRKKDDD